ncbi:unnamed protein product [Caenorhabditis bovis]|uniref:Arrestin-like N-terminal domain-containing protein n=1 Tax=Caenorhabditis bovis TaxID=2654633 RepID=A0A8S1FG83_9PELO|nr:unnamed protein product [Caenorhabditis bovis]
MDKIRIELRFDKSFYFPGDLIEGQIICTSSSGFEVDSVVGRIRGDIIQLSLDERQSCSSIVDETVELWRHCSLDQMLGLYDENQNETFNIPHSTTFPIRIPIPSNAPPTFHCPESPVNVKYSIEIQLKRLGSVIAVQEAQIPVVPRNSPTNSAAKPIAFSKHTNFTKGRSIFVEVLLKTDVFSTTDRVDACINISNRWKHSLKYVHLNVVRRIQLLSPDDRVLKTVRIDTTGVGLPSYKSKVAVGESFSFRPNFNIPALPPTFNVNGLFKTDYLIKVSYGRSHSFILDALEVPIKIVSTNIDERTSCRDDVLIDITPTSTFSNHQKLIDFFT